ncbi:MAG: hypothetical protein ACO1NZ_04680, partial [Adhaeribacter sp.]
MEKFSGFPYVKVQFTKTGRLYASREVQALEALLATGQVSDLLVMAHGWNNDMAEAKTLYRNFLAQFARAVKAADPETRRFAVLGVMWPSKKFAEQELIAGAGAAAGLGNSGPAGELEVQLERLKGFFDGRKANKLLEQAKQAARDLNSPLHAQAPENFVRAMTELLALGIVAQTDGQAPEEGRAELRSLPPRELLASLEQVSAPAAPGAAGGGGAAAVGAPGAALAGGGAAGLGDFFSNTLAGARNLLNFVTYYQMKERAGKVGSLGLHPLLLQLRQKFPQVQLHLIGHSFGARLVTAAVAGPGGQDRLQVATLTLLQAAFSHYGLAEKYDGQHNGFFRRVVASKKVTGPILISFSQQDKAVGLAYAIASRIANQVAAAIGGPQDIYGGMGRNGALKTPEAVNGQKLDNRNRYLFEKGKIYNLDGNTSITNHSDICRQEVAQALLSA